MTTRGSTATLNAPLGTIPIHIRGGYILPTQDPAVNTVASRKNPFGLLVALDDNGQAAGNMYWDQGDDLNPLENGDYAYLTFTAKGVSIKLYLYTAILLICVPSQRYKYIFQKWWSRDSK